MKRLFVFVTAYAIALTLLFYSPMSDRSLTVVIPVFCVALAHFCGMAHDWLINSVCELLIIAIMGIAMVAFFTYLL